MDGEEIIDFFQIANKLSEVGKSEQAIEAYEKALAGPWMDEKWNVHFNLFLEYYYQVVSFENYGYVLHSLEEQSDVDENTKERANTWNSRKVLVGELQNDTLQSIVNELKYSLNQ